MKLKQNYKNKISRFQFRYNIGVIVPYSKIAERYIAKEYFIFQLSAFAFLYLILLINQLLVQAKNLLSKNIAIDVLMKMLVYVSPSILLWAIPFSAIIGTFMALGRLSNDKEVLVLRAYGFNRFKIFKPFIFYSLILSGFSLFISNFITPYTNKQVKKVYQEIAQSVAIDAFKPYSTTIVGDRIISVGSRDQDTIYDVNIFDKDNKFNNRSISSPKADIVKTSGGVVVLKMTKVAIVSAANDYTLLNYQRATSDILNYYLNSKDYYIDEFGNDTLSTPALISRLYTNTVNIIHNYPDYQYLRKTKPFLERYKLIKPKLRSHTIRSTAITLYEKISLAFLPFILTYLALETSFLINRSDSNLGLALGVLLSVFYWFLVYIVRFYLINFNSSVLVLFIPEIVLIIIVAVIRYNQMKFNHLKKRKSKKVKKASEVVEVAKVETA